MYIYLEIFIWRVLMLSVVYLMSTFQVQQRNKDERRHHQCMTSQYYIWNMDG